VRGFNISLIVALIRFSRYTIITRAGFSVMFKTSDCDTGARNIQWSVGLGINDLKLVLTLGTFRPVWSPILETLSDFLSVTELGVIYYKVI